MPSPRACHATFFTSGVYKVFNRNRQGLFDERHRSFAVSFGGRSGGDGKLNDIHIFDLDTAEWFDVEDIGRTPFGNVDGSEAYPMGRSWHSLTRISPDSAVLFGGYDNHSRYDFKHGLALHCNFPGIDSISRTLGDCWVLDIEAMLNGGYGFFWDEIWFRCEHHEDTPWSNLGQRLGHHAIKEPNSRFVVQGPGTSVLPKAILISSYENFSFSRRLWIVGGMSGDIAFAYPNRLKHADRVKELTFSSDLRLKVLALESVVKNVERLAPEVQRLPINLRKLVEARSRKNCHMDSV